VSTSQGRDAARLGSNRNRWWRPRYSTVGPRVYDREHSIAPPGCAVGVGSGGTGEAPKEVVNTHECVRRL
jgi:hypothetical protein